MKIAFINIYQGKVERGAETFVKEISKRLSAKNEIRIYGGWNVPQKRWPLLWRFYLDPHGFATFFYTFRILYSLWREKFDFIIPLNGGWQPAMIRILTWIYGGKVIISGQSGMGWDDRFNLWCFPDSFVTLSQSAAKWAGRVNSLVKVQYIPNGVDLERFNPQGKAFSLDLKKPVILCVAAFAREKRLDLIIKAVSGLKNASLLIVGGGGNLKAEIELLGKKLLGKRFKSLSVLHENMPEIYRTAKIFTLPSIPNEAFGNALVEAMATNLPVVATKDRIRREIVGDAGILVDPTNNREYQKALSKALNSDFGNKPRLQASKFSWDSIAGKYEMLFEKLSK